MECEQKMMAHALWQGSNTMSRSVMTQLQTIIIGDWHHAAAVCQIMAEFDDADDLPLDMVLWHACHKKPNMTQWVSTSASRKSAIQYGMQKYPNGFKLYKFVVKDTGVRGIAVGSDPSYEHEKEVLLMMGCKYDVVSRKEVDGVEEVEAHLQCIPGRTQ